MVMASSAEILEIRERQPRSLALNEKLDVEGLKAAIFNITGLHCHGLTKKAEGGFHRVYFAHCEGGQDFVARVAFDISDFRGTRKMESEVATIAWLTQNTDVPVPKIISYDPSTNNAANAPFILMEKARIPGLTLTRKWETMSTAEKALSVTSLAKISISLLKTRFDVVGSLYPSPSKESGIVVGPMMLTCNPWCFNKDLSLGRGPWRTQREYFLACIARERAWTVANGPAVNEKWTARESDIAVLGGASFQGGYIALYDRLTAYVRNVSGLDDAYPHSLGPFVLRHPDLDRPNIMVAEDDSSCLTLIDWECANTTPVRCAALIPEFLTYDQRDPANPYLREVYLAECRKTFPDLFAASEMEKNTRLVDLELACQLMSIMRSPEYAKAAIEKVLRV
ncbi:hypothetical protein BDZ89DRAFT_1161673, partial [Hymenopellis radicata]